MIPTSLRVRWTCVSVAALSLHEQRSAVTCSNRRSGREATPRSRLRSLWSRAKRIGERRMAERRIGIVMHGVTGRMGTNQHLIRSILAIRAQGGVAVGREVIWPEPVLIGRDERKLALLAAAHGLERWSTD